MTDTIGRTCRRCNIYKPAEEFYLTTHGKLRSPCKTCMREIEREYRNKRLALGLSSRPGYAIPKRQRMAQALAQVVVNPQKLTEARQRRRWTQADVQEILGLSANTLNNWETGRRTPSGEMLARLLLLYAVSVPRITDNAAAFRASLQRDGPEED